MEFFQKSKGLAKVLAEYTEEKPLGEVKIKQPKKPIKKKPKKLINTQNNLENLYALRNAINKND